MLRRLTAALSVAATLATPAVAQTTYTSSAAWTSAVGAGNVSWTVDFSGFTTDTPFRTSAVDAGPFSLQQAGTTGSFRNQIDVSPFEFESVNGTTLASLYTNFGETTVNMTLDAPVRAWGAEFALGTIAEGLQLDLFGPGNALLATLGVASDGFFGFVLAGGQELSRLSFRSATSLAGDTGEGFALDNVRGAATSSTVPEPGTWVLLGTGLIAVGIASVRRKRLAA